MKQFVQRFHKMQKFTIQLRNLNTVITLLLLRNITDFSQLNIDVNSNIPTKKKIESFLLSVISDEEEVMPSFLLSVKQDYIYSCSF